jgi:threonine/homoserine/homoserine lactone efflux protein
VAESAVSHSGLAVLFARPRLQRGYRRFGRVIDRVAGGVCVAVGARFLLAKG